MIASQKTMSSALSVIDYLSQRINRIDTRLVFFLLLILNYTSLILTGNEEQYLSISKQYINPNWVLNSFHLNEWPGARLIHQSFTGFLLQYISIPVFAFWAKWINFALLSIPLGKIFKTLKINNIEVLFLFQLFYLNHTHGDQAFFSDEWIFGEYQGKTIAYIFVLYSLLALIEQKFKKSFIFSVLATYLHVLVGGWFFATSLLYLIFSTKSFKKTLKWFALYLLVMSPLIIFLASTILGDSAKVINGINLNWVYVYFRHHHHLNPFHDLSFFRATAFGGIRIIIISTALLFAIRPVIKDDQSKTLRTLILSTFLIIYTFLIVAFADRFFFDRAGSFLLQLYPFRITAISKLMLLLFSAIIIKRYFLNDWSKKYLNGLLLIIIIPFLLSRATKTTANLYRANGLGQLDFAVTELSSYVKKNTDRQAVFFLNIDSDDQLQVSFYRALERGRYADYKFVPAGTDKLYDWYQRILISRKASHNIDHLFLTSQNEKIDYFISTKKLNDKKLKIIYQNNKYYLYQLTSQE